MPDYKNAREAKEHYAHLQYKLKRLAPNNAAHSRLNENNQMRALQLRSDANTAWQSYLTLAENEGRLRITADNNRKQKSHRHMTNKWSNRVWGKGGKRSKKSRKARKTRRN